MFEDSFVGKNFVSDERNAWNGNLAFLPYNLLHGLQDPFMADGFWHCVQSFV